MTDALPVDTEDAEDTEDAGTGHTSWKRFGVFTVIGGVAVGGLLYALANGAVAAQFVVSDLDFRCRPTSWSALGSSSTAESTSTATTNRCRWPPPQSARPSCTRCASPSCSTTSSPASLPSR